MTDEHKAAMKAAGDAAREARANATPGELLDEIGIGAGHPAREGALRRLTQMRVSMRVRYLRAMSGKSMAAAIHSQCLECVGWEREEVRLCTAPACPLYPYRPYSTPGDDFDDEDTR